MRRNMRTLCFVCLAIGLCGCSSIRRNDAAMNAVTNNLISGLSISNHFETWPWVFPSTPMGPYSSINGFEGTITNGPDKNQPVVFFLGKVRTTGEWEECATMMWTNGEWK